MEGPNSSSQIKNTISKNLDHKTTNTKDSNAKPDILRISMSRNQNSHKPALFNSVKKINGNILNQKDLNSQYQSQAKSNNIKKKRSVDTVKQKTNLFDELNMKVSIDYINSLYCKLGLEYGYKLQSKLWNKQNQIGDENQFASPLSKQEKDCLQKINQLIQLKDKVNQTYNSMKNSHNLFSYLLRDKTQKIRQVSSSKTDQVSMMHQQIVSFIQYYKSKGIFMSSEENELKDLQSLHLSSLTKEKIIRKDLNQQQEQENIDAIINNLRQEIANQKILCHRLEKQERFLIDKLFITQKKTNDLKNTFINLQILNTNLRDTMRLSLSKRVQNTLKSPTLKRSLSAKVQQIKRYNLDDSQTNPQQKLLKKNSS